ncbi:MAG: pyridoxamine 5'-phosphate oxidase family protein [Lachnospiraceae bacterium]|nr:pyridoxamine 5'-phosphate oxidase family protein [Lachnospiraceae bacterium]
MSKVMDFLNEAGIFYLATCDGDQPKARPLGAKFEIDGKVYFAVGDFKNVYKQLQANPKCEIVACKPNAHWLRYTGKAVFATDPKLSEMALEQAPNLRKIYNEETGYKLALFTIEDATCVDIAMMGEGENLLDE